MYMRGNGSIHPHCVLLSFKVILGRLDIVHAKRAFGVWTGAFGGSTKTNGEFGVTIPPKTKILLKSTVCKLGAL